ncbi:hypothetical protein TPHA_0L00810 [Tetrapisispora phaffii CBS 4417]|uniref:ABC transporter domain-containing protein n=1 Tax=Tetrapisispora phaffii (strain ATCC 24235 / CBS 4417 / NBRC 1672 / NRRL Y-8282 / UCD 70-5) TaxID=1071381 RepID=G8BZW0_TETPH|nr:hypothetical protein TPHA_0L00810 [Tetrapisispora phaffii CBS 4417]CCE65438.1 hypothetical protein TPHA_0L00810 [Tetrapisispora phaffii CBS 4417]
MSFSNYFNPVADASVTFNGANIHLDTLGSNAVRDAETLNSRAPGVSSSQINDLTFQAKQGEVVLVLGKQSSELFKSIFHGNDNLCYSPEGSVRFKDYEYKQYSKKCPQEIIYNNEQDVHFPYLTVAQTIDFAIECKFKMPLEERINLRNQLLEEFGLSHVLDTFVGNDFVRGVSGGERKRISIIETFISNGSVYLWDNSTKGLDSATALDFLSILRTMADATRSVNLVKISQASDKIVEKFDKILMFTESYQVFYGTVDECLKFFHDDLGIKKDPNDCIIEYLTYILNLKFRDNEQYGSVISDSNTTTSEINTEEDLYHHWINSDIYRNLKSSIGADTPCVATIDAADIKPNFTISAYNQVRSCTRRAFQRIIGDKAYIISQFIAVIVQSLVIGSLFYDVPLTTVGSYSRGSLTFFSLLFFTFLTFADMPSSFQRKPIVKKHTQLYFYDNWVETTATIIYDYFFKTILVIIFSIILYFLAHFQFAADRYFIFLLFLVLYNITVVTLFTLIALFSPTLAISNLVAGILLLAIAVYASYVIYIRDMHPWFVWIAYLNPARYAMEAILTNELFNVRLDCTETIVPRGKTYDDLDFTHRACAWQGATLGNTYVRGQDYLLSALSYKYSHVWRNFGIIIGFLVFYICCSLFISQYITPLYTAENLDRWMFYAKKYIPFISQNSTKSHPIDDIDDSDSINTISSFDTPVLMDEDKEGKDHNIKHYQVERDEEIASQKHVISWKNINYTIGDKLLIDNASGYISSGLTALMGESGAGKTTLLNILSQRTESGVVTGEIMIDGMVLNNGSAFKRSIGFVQQQDVHLDELTVKESLEISCTLRGDGDKKYMDTVSKMLKLPSECMVRDLTPTEKKLLSIGVELVTKPSLLLFLDEPTSGLDSEAAVTIVKFLKKLSMQGQAILCTIHQPSKSVISYFDSIYLLKRGGQCVYFGPMQEACDYFVSKDSSLVYDREFDNPADFIIDTVGKSNAIAEKDEFKSVSNWSDTWINSQERLKTDAAVLDLEEIARNSGVDYTANVWSQPSYMKQLKVITKRQYLCTRRDKAYVIAKYLLNAGAGLFIGFSFWHIKHNILGLQNVIFLCFMSMCVSSPLINQVQDKALISKEVYLAREARSNTYHWSVLILAQNIIEIPLAVTSSTLFFVCCYFCCGVDTAPHIAGVWFLNYIVFAMYYSTFGLWLIYTAPDLQTAAVFVAFFYSFTAAFCGVMQPYSLFPGFWKFMYRVSPYTYFIETFVSLLLHDRPVICDQGEYVPTSVVGQQNCGEFMEAYVEEFGGMIMNKKAKSVCAYCTYVVGDDFLTTENMSYHHRWRNFGLEFVYVGFNFFAMFFGFYFTYVGKYWPTVFKAIGLIIPFRKARKLTKHSS